jgi:predicted nucleotidyltransferase
MPPATQSITTLVPEGCALYVFGSYLRIDNPTDFDLLVVYDPQIVAPARVYAALAVVTGSIEEIVGLDVNLMALTQAEEAVAQWRKRTCAVEIGSVHLTRRGGLTLV